MVAKLAVPVRSPLNPATEVTIPAKLAAPLDTVSPVMDIPSSVVENLSTLLKNRFAAPLGINDA